MATQPVKGVQCTVKDETGNIHGYLKVLRREGKNSAGQVTWRCLCLYKECGNESVTAGATLRSGRVVSCGCFNRELVAKSATKHGLSHSPLYEAHKSMMHRCYHSNNHSWSWHGGRGITVVPEWHNVSKFVEDMKPSWDALPKDGQMWTLDRKDTNGNYSFENCRWATQKTQCNNKRNNVHLTYKGETKTAAEWGDIVGISGCLIIGRVKRLGWSIERALTEPRRKHSARPEV